MLDNLTQTKRRQINVIATEAIGLGATNHEALDYVMRERPDARSREAHMEEFRRQMIAAGEPVSPSAGHFANKDGSTLEKLAAGEPDLANILGAAIRRRDEADAALPTPGADEAPCLRVSAPGIYLMQDITKEQAALLASDEWDHFTVFNDGDELVIERKQSAEDAAYDDGHSDGYDQGRRDAIHQEGFNAGWEAALAYHKRGGISGRA